MMFFCVVLLVLMYCVLWLMSVVVVWCMLSVKFLVEVVDSVVSCFMDVSCVVCEIILFVFMGELGFWLVSCVMSSFRNILELSVFFCLVVGVVLFVCILEVGMVLGMVLGIVLEMGLIVVMGVFLD